MISDQQVDGRREREVDQVGERVGRTVAREEKAEYRGEEEELGTQNGGERVDEIDR